MQRSPEEPGRESANSDKSQEAEGNHHRSSITRRGFLTTGTAMTFGAPLLGLGYNGNSHHTGNGSNASAGSAREISHAAMHQMGTVGQLAYDGREPVNPMHFLTAFNKAEFPKTLPRPFYKQSRLPDGQTLHEYLFVAYDKEIEIAPGLYFPAWTYNGQVPGPTLRATQGDRIRIWFINQGSHPHTIHFHGWHPFEQDGSMRNQFVEPAKAGSQGDNFDFGPGADVAPWLKMDRSALRQQGLEIYEFDAEPVGLHLYHCHSTPLKRHIHKGLYGTFIVDPPGTSAPADRRPKIDPDTNKPLPDDHPVHEMVVVMNSFDTTFDDENEVYAANSIAFAYLRQPIPVRAGDLVRIYLVNVTEFDPINSFHLHAGFFRVYRTGTNLRSEEYTDTVMMCQAERAILEFRFREGWPGKYMFHAHQSEFAELGWMSLFDVRNAVNEEVNND